MESPTSGDGSIEVCVPSTSSPFTSEAFSSWHGECHEKNLSWIGNFSWKTPISTGGCRFSQNKIWDIVLASFFGSETMKFFHEWLVIVCMESSCRGGNWLEPQKSGASRYQQEKQEWNWYESGLMWATLDLKKQAHSFGVPEKKKLCKNESVDKFWDSWWVRTGQWPLSGEPATLMVKSPKNILKKCCFNPHFLIKLITESHEVPVSMFSLGKIPTTLMRPDLIL